VPDLPDLFGAFTGGWLGKEILAPTTKAVGEQMRDNLANVARHWARLLRGGRPADGAIPLKLVKAAYDVGAVCEDELSASYIGGVLASSQSGIDRDDRAANLLALLGRLSIYQIRTHYIFYAAAQQVLANTETDLRYKFERVVNAQFYLPGRVWRDAMEMTKGESEQWKAIRTHVMHGMRREHLIEQGYTYASPTVLRRFTSTRADFPEPGFFFTLSPLGIELFSSAHGFYIDPFESFLSPSIEFAHDGIAIKAGCATVSSLPLLPEEDPQTGQ